MYSIQLSFWLFITIMIAVKLSKQEPYELIKSVKTFREHFITLSNENHHIEQNINCAQRNSYLNRTISMSIWPVSKSGKKLIILYTLDHKLIVYPIAQSIISKFFTKFYLAEGFELPMSKFVNKLFERFDNWFRLEEHQLRYRGVFAMNFDIEYIKIRLDFAMFNPFSPSHSLTTTEFQLKQSQSHDEFKTDDGWPKDGTSILLRYIVDEHNSIWILRYWVQTSHYDLEIYHETFVNNKRKGYICHDIKNQSISLTENYCGNNFDQDYYLWPSFDFGFICNKLIYLVFTAKSTILLVDKSLLTELDVHKEITFVSIESIFFCPDKLNPTAKDKDDEIVHPDNNRTRSDTTTISSEFQTIGSPKSRFTSSPHQSEKNEKNVVFIPSKFKVIRKNTYLILFIVGKYLMIIFFFIIDYFL